MSITQAVKEKARQLGFILAGITTPDPPPHWQTYEYWLSMGRHGSMEYLTDPRRIDPHRVLPDCRSILMLAVRYPPPGSDQLPEEPHPRGKVASYAWGQDYHMVIPERLKELVQYIQTLIQPPVSSRYYTDTGPILERDLAQRAGLGWIGKNTCLINPKVGSYFLLAEILLGIELEPDIPFSFDHCGTCTRCIQSCPTGCIQTDRTLDARRCLSYLTIENKGEIPPDLRQKMGKRIFGCDICQQVCPWNRFTRLEHDPAFDPRQDVPSPYLVAEMGLDQGQFNRKYRNSPILRSKRRGYLRNVAVALGNSGDPAALQALESAAVDPEPLIRDHALWALEQFKNRDQE